MEDRYIALFKDVKGIDGKVYNFIGCGSTEEEAVNRLYRNVSDVSFATRSDEVEHKKKFVVLDRETGCKAQMIYCVVTFHYVFDEGRVEYEQVKSSLEYQRIA